MFTVYTFVQPLLTRVTGFTDVAVSPILLVFGVGMIVGNLLGGRVRYRGGAHGVGLIALAWIGALVPASALLVALWAIRLERNWRATSARACSRH